MSSSQHDSLPLVDSNRILTTLQAFARIGYQPGGRMLRLAFTQDDLRARQLLLHLMNQLGLETRVDEFGNVFGRLPATGEANQRPPVLIGSHLDTVIDGGRFDGSLGVTAALECVALLKDHVDALERPVEVVSFAAEESSRFGRGTLGSAIVAGVWHPDEIMHLQDSDGRTLGSVLQRIGLDPARVSDARRSAGDFAAFLEIHIEQGRVLEESENQVGIVSAIAAPTRFRLTLTGQADHSGATPMTLRRDALAGAAEVILAVERLSKTRENVVGTVGTIQADPGAINIVPGRTRMSIDIRATSSENKQAVVDALNSEITDIARRRDLEVVTELLSNEQPVQLDDQLITLMESCSQSRNIPAIQMPSGAGHDAMQMASICPSALLLVPSRDGISHNPDEWTDLDDLVAGIQVYADAAWQLAMSESGSFSR
jgi:beta-ureidopropionase / N-carbamoyl-L-amino-acid hydrolase